MGGSSGNSGPFKIGGLSGQGGGRILPGSSSGIGELITNTPRIDENTNVVSGEPDRRPSPPFGSPLDTVFAAPGGGPGQLGKGDAFTIYVRDFGDSDPNPQTPFAGGGGGWGAAGGAGGKSTDETTFQQGGNPGAAGGKAIKTNGHSVTWLGGSDRAYGAIG